jgi:hypothetical protein
MHQKHTWQSDDDEVRLETMNPNDKKCNFFLELQGHP